MNNIAPLTPEDCDLRDFAFMPLDVARLRDSDLAATESPEACWTAVLLWAASWHQVPAASLPNDDRVLSNLAGYGRVVKEWHRVKEGALRGWIECSDGRLYHPVVAEKANESWHEKLKYAHGKLCGRLRKKGISSDDLPSFEQWTSDGMPEDSFYLPSVIPTERANNSTGNGENSTGIPPENTLKGQGQGQGQGQGLINNIVADSCESSAGENKKPKFTADDRNLAEDMLRAIRKVAPSAKGKTSWPDDIRLMRERDNHTLDEIREMFVWANADSFWSANILSPSKLRDKWPQLEAQRNRPKLTVMPAKKSAHGGFGDIDYTAGINADGSF